MSFQAAFGHELLKVGARAGLKIIRNLIEHGGAEGLAKAERLAITPGVLKKTRAGSEIKDLGRGMEGVSTLVAHPKKGIAVRKLYDPHGVSTPKLIQRKEEFGHAMQGARGLPAYHGAATAEGGHRMHFSEYVPGTNMQDMQDRAHTAFRQLRKDQPERAKAIGKGFSRIHDKVTNEGRRLQMQAKHRGFEVNDVHPGNVQIGEGGKSAKIVDTMPYKPGDTDEQMMKRNKLEAARMRDRYYTDKKVTGQIKHQAFRPTTAKDLQTIEPEEYDYPKETETSELATGKGKVGARPVRTAIGR